MGTTPRRVVSCVAVAGRVPEIEGFEDLIVIGRGGFSTVYRAYQSSADRDVAIKVVDAVLDEATRQRFERECRALGVLAAHPGICTLYSFGRTADEHPYLVLELCERSLAERVRSEGPLSPDEAVEVLTILADAIAHVHDRGIVHRDIKPDNVLETQFGQPVLTDFGIARMADGFHTTSGMVTASLAHAAPEVLDGEEPTVASDLWSLASTGYELLTGSAPFKRAGEPNSVLITRVFRDPPPNLREHGVPDRVASVLEGGLAKDPADRFPDMQTLAAAFRGEVPAPSTVTQAVPEDGPRRSRVVSTAASLRKEPPPTVAQPSNRSGGRRRGGRHGRLPALGAVASVGLVVAGMVLLLGGDEDPRVGASTTTLATTTTVATTTTLDLRASFCVDVKDNVLNIRTGPSRDFQRIGGIPDEACGVRDLALEPEIDDQSGEPWRHIEWEGMKGWVHGPSLRSG